jgi:endogenous inhibitor of DNA gyrase (YacG/DUF329 family)
MGFAVVSSTCERIDCDQTVKGSHSWYTMEHVAYAATCAVHVVALEAALMSVELRCQQSVSSQQSRKRFICASARTKSADLCQWSRSQRSLPGAPQAQARFQYTAVVKSGLRTPHGARAGRGHARKYMYIPPATSAVIFLDLAR